MIRKETTISVIETHRRNPILRYFFRQVLLLIITLSILHGTVSAQANDQASFGIRPTKAYEGRPETTAYFSFESAAGTVIEDEALILNDGPVPVALKLFAADGVTAQNGGTSLVAPGDPGEQTGVLVSDWITLPYDYLELQPGEDVVVPFSITIPPDAPAGDYVGGLMVEALSDSSEITSAADDQAQFTVNVVKRVGVAVVIQIPGARTSALVVDRIGFETQDEQGATFAVRVNNIGNVMTKAQGNLLITDKDNNTLSSLPINIETVLPGDATTIYLFQSLHLADGDYLMNVGLIYDGGTAILEGVELRIRNGVAVKGDAETVIQKQTEASASVQTIQPVNYSLGEFWIFVRESQEIIMVILLITGFLFIVVMGLLIWRRKKTGPGGKPK